MLSYKEYKLLNESLYGAFNLGLKSHGTVGGIVSASGVNGTEVAIEAQAEEAIEEAKKMKKKMDEDDSEEEELEDDKPAHEEEEGDEDSHEEEEGDEDSEDDSEDDEEGDEDEEKELAFMKKKSKKEWSEVMSDLEEVLEAIEDEEALTEVKKGLEMMKKGMEKGCGKMMGKKCGKYMSEGKKAHKTDCDCPVCEKKKDHDEEDKGSDEGLTAGQKKLPKALQDAILAKKGKKKGDKEDKKCGKNMNEEEAKWWKSVNEMLGADPNQKNWDGGWSEVGEVQQAVREGDQTE